MKFEELLKVIMLYSVKRYNIHETGDSRKYKIENDTKTLSNKLLIYLKSDILNLDSADDALTHALVT